MPVRPTLRLSRSDLADLNAFRAVERARSFTQAAVELGEPWLRSGALRELIDVFREGMAT